MGTAFGASAVIGVWLVARNGPSPWRLFRGFVQPLVACLMMCIGVLGVRRAMTAIDAQPWLDLIVEMATGAVVYVAAALVVCRATSRDLLGLVTGMLKRRRKGSVAASGDESAPP